MLVLRRELNQVIRIGENIKITVTEIRGRKIGIGIDAPPEIPVHREERYQQLKSAGLPLTTQTAAEAAKE